MLSFCVLALVFYLWHMYGVTIGLHRLLSHRAFKCPKFVEYFWVAGAYLAFHGSPIWWATIHRAHHRHVDTPLDPHSPKGGMWKAYTFYRDFKYQDHVCPITQSPDLMKDPIYRALEQYEAGNWYVAYAINVTICILFRVLLFWLFGWQVALASLVGAIGAFNVPLILNILCHIPHLGYKNYATEDDSVNIWWMAVIALGDGWHNNHHAHPGSSNMGIRSREIDPSFLVLRMLKAVGLVQHINDTIKANGAAVTSELSSLPGTDIAAIPAAVPVAVHQAARNRE